jgi:hypothetical protein
MSGFLKAPKLLLILAVLALHPFTSSAQKKMKCMIQMTNYMGEGAYVVISLVDAKGTYAQTLYVMGSDKKWYKTIKEWYKFSSKKPENLSAITGASVSGGDRSVHTIEIDESKINKGFVLRFESAVEDKPYYQKDVEIPLTTENLSAKIDGTGYIRYVRLSSN